MSKFTVNVEHNGKTYGGQLGTIKSTSLGIQDHGCLTAMLHVEFKCGGIGVGGIVLDTPVKDTDGKFLLREGSAFGADHIIEIINTAGVEKWESLPGKQIIVLFEGKSLWGSTAAGFAGITNEEVLIFKEHAELWIEREVN